MRRALIGFGAFLLAGAPAVRSQPPQTTPPDVPGFAEAIDVRVVNVEVVVTDAKGEPVRGLGPADFRLLVDGREVPLDHFSEVVDGRASSSPESGTGAEPVARNYLVFLDDSFAVASPRNEALERLAADLSRLGPEDRMAVLAFDGERIDVLSPWSADRTALAEALRAARQRPAQGNRLISTKDSMANDVELAILAATTMELTREEMQAMVEVLNTRVPPEARTQLGRTAWAM